MSEVIGIKLNAASSSNLGYIHVLAVKHGKEWEQGNSETMPENGQVFVYSEFGTEIQGKFQIGEAFQIAANLDDDDGKNCKYSARGKDAKNIDRGLELTTIFETNKRITADNDLYFESPIKPIGQVFFITKTVGDDNEIIGPFDVLSSQLDRIKRAWQINVRPAQKVGSLEPFHIFKAPFKLIGSDDLIELRDISTPEGGVYLGFNILNYLGVVSAPSVLFIEPKTLLTLLDDALPQNLKLGRKGRREVLAQLEASKKLNPLIKEKGLELLQQFEGRENLIQRLANLGEIDPIRSSQLGASENSDNDNLVAELKASNQKLRSECDALSKKLRDSQKSGEQENIAKLEATIEALKDKISCHEKHENLQKEIDYLQRDKLKLQGESNNLKQVLDELRAEINKTDQQFISKAASVLPFLGVLDKVNSGDEKDTKPNELTKSDFEVVDDNEILNLILNRTKELGYVALGSFLECAIAMAFSSRLIGFYGEPGTGKTTLARLLGHSIEGGKSSRSFISVGKGWSTSADFIGFKNPFADRFDFKNDFFKKYHSKNQANSSLDHPPDSIVFDEASLSSIDSYLSDFMSVSNGLNGLELDKFSVGGEQFLLPSTTRFFLTFNFDENTESLPRKLVDRMPLIHCENVDSADRAVINEEKVFKPIHRDQLAEFLKKQSVLARDNESRYRDVCDDIFELWGILPELKNISARRRIQINNFIQLVSNFKDLDEGHLGEFFAMSFLLPIISGTGEDYASKLDQVGERSHGVKIRYEIQKIIENGRHFGSYKYL